MSIIDTIWRRRKKQPKILTQLRIDEVSCVDHGAGDGVRIMLMKRNDAETPEQIFKAAADALSESLDSILSSGDSADQKCSAVAESFQQCEQYLGERLGVADLTRALAQLDVLGKNIAGILKLNPGDRPKDDQSRLEPEGDDLPGRPNPPQDDDLIDRIVAAHNGKMSRLEAMHWLLSHPLGRAAARVLPIKQQKKDEAIMDTKSVIRKIAKDGSTDMSEGEIVQMISDDAPLGVRGDVHFAKMYSQDEGLRRAIQIAKGNVGALSRDVSKNVRKAAAPDMPASSPAYDSLLEKANAYRELHPNLTEAQAFAKIYSDPKNRDLAVRQRDEHFASE
jgi:hypothetical protein